MITTLGLWQIVALIVLTQTAIGILSRAVILTALVLHRRWSKVNQNPTSPSQLSSPKTEWSESGEFVHNWRIEPYGQYEGDDFAMGYADDLDTETQRQGLGNTGVQPAGVSYQERVPTSRTIKLAALKPRSWLRRR